MVAVGNLYKVWLDRSQDLGRAEWRHAFRDRFGADWTEVLDSADASIAYNAFNDAFFAVRDLHPLEGVNLEALLEKAGITAAPNIVAA